MVYLYIHRALYKTKGGLGILYVENIQVELPCERYMSKGNRSKEIIGK